MVFVGVLTGLGLVGIAQTKTSKKDKLAYSEHNINHTLRFLTK